MASWPIGFKSDRKLAFLSSDDRLDVSAQQFRHDLKDILKDSVDQVIRHLFSIFSRQIQELVHLQDD